MKRTMHRRKLRNLKKKHLSYENLNDNHAKFKYYTGINVELFDGLFKDIKVVKKLRKGRYRLLSYKNRLIMPLIKLRLNTQFENLTDQVGCSKTAVYDIFRRWINLMYVKLRFLMKWPDHDASTQTLPNVSRKYFPKI